MEYRAVSELLFDIDFPDHYYKLFSLGFLQKLFGIIMLQTILLLASGVIILPYWLKLFPDVYFVPENFS